MPVAMPRYSYSQGMRRTLNYEVHDIDLKLSLNSLLPSTKYWFKYHSDSTLAHSARSYVLFPFYCLQALLIWVLVDDKLIFHFLFLFYFKQSTPPIGKCMTMRCTSLKVHSQTGWIKARRGVKSIKTRNEKEIKEHKSYKC